MNWTYSYVPNNNAGINTSLWTQYAMFQCSHELIDKVFIEPEKGMPEFQWASGLHNNLSC